jgi:chromosome segregation ATPase
VKASLSLTDVTTAVAAIENEPDFARRAKKLLETLEEWLAPSLVTCFERDQAAADGWRVVPELTAGTVPPILEKSLVKLVEEQPADTAWRPFLVRPAGDAPAANIKLLDNWVAPWRFGAASGFLFLRGIAHPSPSSLGDAVALLALPVWPALVSSRQVVDRPASLPAVAFPPAGLPVDDVLRRLEGAASDAQRFAEQLLADVRKEREAVASRPEPVLSAAEIDELRQALDAQREKAATLDQTCRQAEAERDRLRAEADAARSESEALRRQLDEARGQADERQASAGKAEAQAEERNQELAGARQEAEGLAARVKEAEQQRDAARGEAERSAAEVTELRGQIETLRLQPTADETRVASASALGDAQQALKNAELALAQRNSDIEEARRELTALREKAERLEKTHGTTETELERARAESSRLWSSIESLQRELLAEKDQREAARAALEEREKVLQKTSESAAVAEKDVELAHGAQVEANDRARMAEERAQRADERWEKSLETFRSAVETLRRTPFVPPTLRVAVSSVEELLVKHEAMRATVPGTRLARVLFLDRDTAGIERLASDLEAGGVDVLVAHYPEEVSFFLKTPDARSLTVGVLDVMALRGDQDASDMVRLWRQELPHVGWMLSFKPDHPAESERAQRVPVVLTAGYLTRPLEKRAVIDSLGVYLKRQPHQR